MKAYLCSSSFGTVLLYAGEFSNPAATLKKRRALLHVLVMIGLFGLVVHATPSMALDIGGGWTADAPAGVAYGAVTGQGTNSLNTWTFTIKLSSAASTATTIKFTNNGATSMQSFFNLNFEGVNTDERIPWVGMKIIISDTTEDPLLSESDATPHPRRAHIHKDNWKEANSSHLKCVDDYCGPNGRASMALGLKDGTSPIMPGQGTSGGILRLHDMNEDPAPGQPDKPMKFELTFIPQAPILNIAKLGSGNGSVIGDPSGIDCGDDCGEYYRDGTPVMLTAFPDSHSSFRSWSSHLINTWTACTGQSSICSLTAGAMDRTVAAYFQGAALAAGSDRTVALSSDGKVWDWGYYYLINGFNGIILDYSTTPVPVTNLSGVIAVAVGSDYFALQNDGSVWTWKRFLLLNGDATPIGGLSGVIAIAAGGGHVAALKSDGKVWAWGNNGYGQLGDVNRPGFCGGFDS